MPREVRLPIFASLACALLVVVVAAIAYEFGPAVNLDASLVEHLTRAEGSNRYDLANAVTDLVNPLPFVAILTAVVGAGLLGRRRRETLAAVAIVAGANLSTQVIKHLLEHERYQWALGMHQPAPDSFPSGHTTAAASLAVALVLVLSPRLRPLAAAVGALFTLAVGTGLVVIEAHFPSDVLGGLLVVASWTFAAIAALRLHRHRRAEAERNEGERAAGPFAVSLQ
jgi:membrane-associated phospholipid phosphatase